MCRQVIVKNSCFHVISHHYYFSKTKGKAEVLVFTLIVTDTFICDSVKE